MQADREPGGDFSLTRQARREALDAAVARSLPGLTLGLTVLWALITLAHLAVLSGRQLQIMLSVSALTTVLLGLIAVNVRRRLPTPRSAHAIAALVAGLLACNAVLHLGISGDPKQSTNVGILLVSIGFFFRSVRWYFALVAALAVGWLLAMAGHAAAEDWVHFGTMNFIAVALGLLVLRTQSDLIADHQSAVLARQAQADALERLSLTDALTGLSNRRAFDLAVQQELSRLRRAGGSVGLLLVDVDHFKAYNDRLGHLSGDACLKRIAGILGQAVRTCDRPCRFGGEEFAVLLPDSDRADAQTVAERVRRAVYDAGLPHPALGPAAVVTVSIGAACASPGTAIDADTLLRRADEALYRAKSDGRDRVHVAAPAAAETAG